MKISKIASVIGEMWEHCDEETKSRLEDEYRKNKIIYDKEKKTTVQKNNQTEEEEQQEKVAKKKKKEEPEP